MSAPIVSAAAPASLITFLRIVVLLETFPVSERKPSAANATFAMRSLCKPNL